jgi:hypothetical protein
MGDPDRGYGKGQPGGWIYNLLAFVEGDAIRQIGAGLPLSAKSAALVQLLPRSLSTFNCPSRRAPEPYPTEASQARYYGTTYYRNVDAITVSEAKTDYAACVGDYQGNHIQGPTASDLAKIDAGTYDWRTIDESMARMTGISFLRSEIKESEVTDGTSNVYLAGEKSVHPDYYTTGTEYADDNSMYCGYDWDIVRWASATYELVPDHRLSGVYQNYYFGSAHPTLCHMLCCDGSVHGISYNVDPAIHARLGNSIDGLAIDKSEFVE